MFLSPPWGGPSYRRVKKFTLDLLEPKDGLVMNFFFLAYRGAYITIMHAIRFRISV